MTGVIASHEIMAVRNDSSLFSGSLPARYVPKSPVIEVIPDVDASSCRRGSWGGGDAFSYDCHGNPRPPSSKGIFLNTYC
jgi:hypothetical protein